MRSPARFLPFVSFFLPLASFPLAAQTPRGPEIEITALGGPSESVTGAAVAASGSFVLTWNLQPPTGPVRVRFRLFRADGTPRTPELGVGAPAWDQFGGRVAMRSDGRFVVVWTEHVPGHLRVLGRMFGAAGNPVGPPFRLTPNLQGNQRDPDVAMAADGSFVATWSSDYPAILRRDPPDIFARRFSPAAKPLGPEFLVNSTYLDDEQGRPRIAAAPAGAFVIAWESWGGDGDYYDIVLQPFAADGSRRGGELFLEATEGTYLHQTEGAIAWAPDGGFVAVCADSAADSGRHEVEEELFFPFSGIVSRRYAADGTSLGDLVHVNGTAPGRQQSPEITRRPGGYFVVWESWGRQESSRGIFGRRLAADGTPLGGDLRISSARPWQLQPVVALDAQGRGIVAWSEYDTDLSTYRVLARRIVQRNPS